MTECHPGSIRLILWDTQFKRRLRSEVFHIMHIFLTNVGYSTCICQPRKLLYISSQSTWSTRGPPAWWTRRAFILSSTQFFQTASLATDYIYAQEKQIFLQNYEPMATIVADPLHAALHIPGPAGLRATVPGQWLKDALLTLTLFACLCSLRMRGPSASARCLCVSVSFVERF